MRKAASVVVWTGTKALFDPFVECQNTDMRFDDDAKLLFEGLDRRHLVLARLIDRSCRQACSPTLHHAWRGLERCLRPGANFYMRNKLRGSGASD
jgi:hypothetical protein